MKFFFKTKDDITWNAVLPIGGLVGDWTVQGHSKDYYAPWDIVNNICAAYHVVNDVRVWYGVGDGRETELAKDTKNKDKALLRVGESHVFKIQVQPFPLTVSFKGSCTTWYKSNPGGTYPVAGFVDEGFTPEQILDIAAAACRYFPTKNDKKICDDHKVTRVWVDEKLIKKEQKSVRLSEKTKLKIETEKVGND